MIRSIPTLVHDLSSEMGERDCRDDGPDLGRLEARNLEQVLDQEAEPLTLTFDRFKELTLFVTR